MATKSSAYWRKRFEQLEKAQLNKGITAYHELEKQYTQAARAVEKEITAWYSRYAKENKITLTEAKKLLTGRDLEAFRMDVKEYIKKGASLDPKWAKQLEQASVRVHVSRLEALKTQMQQQIEQLAGHELDVLDKVARDIYTDGYYRTAFEIAKGSGVSATFAALDTKKIDKVISKPWAADGREFSSRIWGKRSTLVNDLHTLLTQNIIKGESPDRLIKLISKKFDVSKHQSGRLIATESAYFSSAAQYDSFKEVGVEKYEFVATLDDRTSEICQEMDGQVFNLSDYTIGTNAPPLHCNCRSVTSPWFPDNGGERASRDEKGKYKTVPADMTYKDWKKEFVVSAVVANVFTPAKTVNEATEKAKSLVYQDGKVSFAGINNVDSLNEFIQEAEDIQSKYGVHLDEISTFNGRRTLARANANKIELSKQFFNSSDYKKHSFEVSVTNYKERKIKNIQDLKDKWLSDPNTPERIRLQARKLIRELEEELKYSRHNVFSSEANIIKDTIAHEYGHVLLFRNMDGYNLAVDAWLKARRTGDIYNISKYANTNAHEFFAECFTAREQGEKLPDYIEEMLKKVMGR